MFLVVPFVGEMFLPKFIHVVAVLFYVVCLNDKAFKDVYLQFCHLGRLVCQLKESLRQSGIFCQVAKNCHFEWWIKKETVLHPVNAWRNESASSCIGPTNIVDPSCRNYFHFNGICVLGTTFSRETLPL